MREGPKNPVSDDWLMGPGEDVLDRDDTYDRPLPTSRGVLTSAEIEALLRPDLSDLPAIEPPKSIQPRLPEQFDDRRYDPEESERRRKAGMTAARLSLALGKGAGLKAAIAVQETARVRADELPGLMAGKAGALVCFGQDETELDALVCLPAILADSIIAKACGARDNTGRLGDGWTLSAIDCALLEQLLASLGRVFGEDVRLQSIETDVPYVASLIPDGDVDIMEFTVEAPGLRSDLAIVRTDRTAGRTGAAEPAQLRGKAPVTALATARIASLSVPMSRLTSLKAGSTLVLGLPADQPIELLSGDRDGPVLYEGQLGRKGNKMAVRITRKRGRSETD